MKTKTRLKQRNEQIFRESRRMALQVDFIDTIGDFRRYSRALYAAMMWGKNREREQLKEKEAEGDVK